MTTFYKFLLSIGLAIGALLTIVYLSHKVATLQKEVDNKTVNLKSLERGMLVYKDKNSVLHTQSVQMQNTIDELKDSKDSITIALMDSVKRWKIKASSVSMLGRVNQELEKTTVIKYEPGSYTQKDTSYDFSTRPWIINTVAFTHIQATNHLNVKDTLTMVFADHRETINPPKKFFVLRWFQKKQTIVQADVVHSNPYIHTTGQRFIHVVK